MVGDLPVREVAALNANLQASERPVLRYAAAWKLNGRGVGAPAAHYQRSSPARVTVRCNSRAARSAEKVLMSRRRIPLPTAARPSLYSRLAGYPDTNDADRLARDPAR